MANHEQSKVVGDTTTYGSIGIIFLRCEDDISIFRLLLSRRLGELIPEWTLVGIYYKNPSDTYEVKLFDYWSGAPSNLLAEHLLDNVIKSPLVSKAAIQCVSSADVKVQSNIKIELLKVINEKVSDTPEKFQSLTSHGRDKVNKIIKAGMGSTTSVGSPLVDLKINNPAQAYFDLRYKSSNPSNFPLFLSGDVSDDITYKLLACESLLLDFIKEDSIELQRLLLIMNMYRSYFMVQPLIFNVSDTKNTAASSTLTTSGVDPLTDVKTFTIPPRKTSIDINTSSMSIIKLKKLIHEISSRSDHSLDDLENFLMQTLAKKFK
jgi:hypothetical protein